MRMEANRTSLPTENLNRDPFLGLVYNKLHVRDENFIMPITGATGSGKSGSAISLAINIDVDYSGYTRWYHYDKSGEVVLDKICFTAKQFLEIVKKKQNVGTVIIWDEAGVENDNTEFMSAKSRLIKWVLQTFRFKNMALFLTVPDLESIALSTRRLMHAHMRILGDPPNGLGFSRDKYRFAKIYFIDKKFNGKLIYIRPQFYDPSKAQRIRKIDGYLIPKPPKEVYKKYTEMKAAAIDDLYRNINKELELMYNMMGNKEDIDDWIAKIEQDPEEYMKNGKFNANLIAAYLRIPQTKARMVATVLNAKLEKDEEYKKSLLNDKEVEEVYDYSLYSEIEPQ